MLHQVEVVPGERSESLLRLTAQSPPRDPSVSLSLSDLVNDGWGVESQLVGIFSEERGVCGIPGFLVLKWGIFPPKPMFLLFNPVHAVPEVIW